MKQTFLLFIFFLPILVLGEELTIEKLYESLEKYYPKILAQEAKISASIQEFRSNEGFFDTKLKAKFDKRYTGYYDGEAFDVSIEQPLTFSNTDLYLGYKRSRGEFPSYEGKADTLTDGEWRAGARISLLRDQNIDERRLRLYLSRLNQQQTEQSKNVLLRKLKAEIALIYWEWLTAGRIFEVYTNLYNVAVDRVKGFKILVKNGDLPAIYLVENQQYILKRQNSLTKAKQQFDNLSLLLGLFFRNKQGNIIEVSEKNLPEEYQVAEDDVLAELKTLDLKEKTGEHPEFQRFENQKEMIAKKLLFQESQVLPSLDLAYEVSKDYGEGSDTLEGTENRVKLNFEFPLQNRKASGKKQSLILKKIQIENEQRLFQEKLIQKLKQILNKAEASFQQIQFASQEVDLAQQLLEAEKVKFELGQSDFFLINFREQFLAEAQIRLSLSTQVFFQNLLQFQNILSL